MKPADIERKMLRHRGPRSTARSSATEGVKCGSCYKISLLMDSEYRPCYYCGITDKEVKLYTKGCKEHRIAQHFHLPYKGINPFRRCEDSIMKTEVIV
jgi:hypothetical protein